MRGHFIFAEHGVHAVTNGHHVRFIRLNDHRRIRIRNPTVFGRRYGSRNGVFHLFTIDQPFYRRRRITNSGRTTQRDYVAYTSLRCAVYGNRSGRICKR